ncbi:hypothetical protein NHX12_003703, partial [Muraenolepis orangiensis]
MARHSQSASVPDCPPGSGFVYAGYSLLFVNGNEKAHGQDLGSMGSCLPRFSTAPYLFCDTDNNCHYSSRNDNSYWLSTDEPPPPSMLPITGAELANQSTRIPECPGNWESLWTGYSFVMQCGVGAEGSSQPLVSPGSCLEHFRQVPFIECHDSGTCNYYPDSYSYWLASLHTQTLFSKPEPQTVKGESAPNVISRCRRDLQGKFRPRPHPPGGDLGGSRGDLRGSSVSSIVFTVVGTFAAPRAPRRVM